MFFRLSSHFTEAAESMCESESDYILQVYRKDGR